VPVPSQDIIRSCISVLWVSLYFYNISIRMKSLKIPKMLSESVNRRTDNTTAKRKRTKGQTTIYKTYT